jgi:hypothetical protein
MKLLGTMVFAVVTATIVSAQSPTLDVTIARGRCVGSLRAEMTEPYQGGPWAGMPASCLNDSPQATAKGFRIRAWKEAESARVVVYVVVEDAAAPDKERESQIAIFTLSSGQSVNVTQAGQYNALPFTVSAK